MLIIKSDQKSCAAEPEPWVKIKYNLPNIEAVLWIQMN